MVRRVPVVRVGEADLAPASLTLLVTKQALSDIRVCWLVRALDALRANDRWFRNVLIGFGEASGNANPGVLFELLPPARRVHRYPYGLGVDRTAGHPKARDVEDVRRRALRMEHEPHYIDLFAR